MNTTLHFNVNVTTGGPTLGENVISSTPIRMLCDGKSNFNK